MSHERVPPSDLDAERCVLGCMLLNPATIDDVAMELTASHFYSDPHRRIFAALVALHNSGKEIDAVTLAHQLQVTGDLEDCGGPQGLLPIMESVPHTAHWAYYCRVVRELAYRRDVIQQATELIRAAHDPTADQEQVLQSVEARITQLVESRAQGNGVIDLTQCLLEAVVRIETGKVVGTPTGWCDLDEVTTGLHEGQLVVVAARPGVGKSAFAVNLAHQLSESVPVLYCSLEMSRLELAERMLSLDSCVSLHDLRNGGLTADQQQQLCQSANLLHTRKLWIDDEANRTVMGIASLARLYRRRHQIGLLVIDYLQLLMPQDRRQPREQQIAEMTRALKCLAKSLHITVIVLAQLNREVERRSDKRPMLSDLRESGAIEQDADQVWLLHRPALCMDDTDPEIEQARGKLEVYVRKNRSGKTGTVTLSFLEHCMRVRNYAAAYYHPGDDWTDNATTSMSHYPGSDWM